ncbi:sigma 54-interacting transcriptional regulator [Sporosarcina sp. CAU 1771]
MSSLYLHPNTEEEVIDTYEEDIIVTSRDGIILKATQISGQHYGLLAEDLLGKSVYDLEEQGIFSPAITPLVIKQKKKVVIVQTTPSGKKVLITGMPFFDEVGEVSFVISYSYEVSELLVIQEYLNELEQEMLLAKEELLFLRKEILLTGGLVIESRSTVRAYETAQTVAPLDVSVVLYGEHGTGRTTLAKTIHKNSSRKNHSFIEVDCEVIPEALFEEQLFGEVQKPGLLSLASEGTLYLKNIDKLSELQQSKLSTILREQRYTPIDSESTHSFDVRIISSSEHTLSRDLYYLLHIIPIQLEPFSKRKEDVIELISAHMNEFRKKYVSNKELSSELFNYLLGIDWKGNHFELKHVIERLYTQSSNTIVSIDDLPMEYRIESDDSLTRFGLEGRTLPNILESVERKVLMNAQERYRTTTEMAKHLGISQPSVVRKLKKYT